MRAYFFGNMYLSSIQQGIQAAHVTSELFTKYKNKDSSKYWNLYMWAHTHKTMILLNGGFAEQLQELINFFTTEDFVYGIPIRVESKDNPYPWAYFKEETASINEALTSVGIILPSRIYETAAELKKTDKLPLTSSDLSNWEIELVERLNTFGMAK